MCKIFITNECGKYSGIESFGNKIIRVKTYKNEVKIFTPDISSMHDVCKCSCANKYRYTKNNRRIGGRLFDIPGRYQ